GCPPGEHETVHAQRGQRENVENSDIHPGHVEIDHTPEDVHLAAVRDHDHRHERRDKRDCRCGEIDCAVCFQRNDAFLEDHLDSAGDRVKQAPVTYAVGTNAQLNPAHELTLKQREVGHGCHQHAEKNGYFDGPLEEQGCHNLSAELS